jgi:MoaA/NifB/PqqE/SkfB family radical SAM enzyme
MMQTPARNYDRVLNNIRNLVAVRRKAHSETPIINLQFLVWRENFRALPEMYELARELDVDAITFNGLAYLRPDQEMSESEFAEMMGMYEGIIRRDEFRRIRTISSFERDISGDVAALTAEMSRQRQGASLASRITRFLSRDDYSLREKVAHHLKVRRNSHADRETAAFDASCIIGWHSLVIRSDGLVAPCCILPTKILGNIFKSSVEDIWYGEPYQNFRRELAAIISDPNGWTPRADHQTVVDLCGKRANGSCPMKSFYFIRDVPFVKQLERTFAEKQASL